MFKYIAIFIVTLSTLTPANAQEAEVSCEYLRDEEGDIDQTFIKCGDEIYVNTNTYNF